MRDEGLYDAEATDSAWAEAIAFLPRSAMGRWARRALGRQSLGHARKRHTKPSRRARIP